MLKYTNGWGHLIMSLATMFVGVLLYLKGVTGLGTGLIAMVASAWFVPSAAKQVAHQVVEEMQQVTEPLAPLIKKQIEETGHPAGE